VRREEVAVASYKGFTINAVRFRIGEVTIQDVGPDLLRVWDCDADEWRTPKNAQTGRPIDQNELLAVHVDFGAEANMKKLMRAIGVQLPADPGEVADAIESILEGPPPPPPSLDDVGEEYGKKYKECYLFGLYFHRKYAVVELLAEIKSGQPLTVQTLAINARVLIGYGYSIRGEAKCCPELKDIPLTQVFSEFWLTDRFLLDNRRRKPFADVMKDARRIVVRRPPGQYPPTPVPGPRPNPTEDWELEEGSAGAQVGPN
jgi:hypothetical protein